MHGTQILIGERLEFVVDTHVLQPHSHPVLDQVAALLQETANIGHVVIVGHASEEGSHAYNHRLASSRAERIWEELLIRGVPRQRLSQTGIGEVAPRAGGPDEAERQRNQRVAFHIKQRFTHPDEVPEYPETQALPWSGQRIGVVQPVWAHEPDLPAGPGDAPSDLDALDLDALDLE